MIKVMYGNPECAGEFNAITGLGYDQLFERAVLTVLEFISRFDDVNVFTNNPLIMRVFISVYLTRGEPELLLSIYDFDDELHISYDLARRVTSREVKFVFINDEEGGVCKGQDTTPLNALLFTDLFHNIMVKAVNKFNGRLSSLLHF